MSLGIFAAFAAFGMCAVLFAYRQGLKDGQALKENKALGKIASPVLKPKSKPVEMPEEFQRYEQINKNINTYKGNAIGQREVK